MTVQQVKSDTVPDTFSPPLPESLLLKYDFFELYPFDGGGRFIQQEIAGSLKDREITENLFRKGGFDCFLRDGKPDWKKFEHWSTTEKSCWLNRLYFVPSAARTALLEQDTELGRMLVEWLLDFHRSGIPPTDEAGVTALNDRIHESALRHGDDPLKDGPMEYRWFDFQPASRIINVIHGLWFLRKLGCIHDDKLAELNDFIRNNALVVYYGEKNEPLRPGNHQAVRGLALVYAGRYFSNPDFFELGSRIVNEHLECDVLPDGMLIDMSPSYHIFECWIGRDASLLGALQPESESRLRKALDLCPLFRCPDGNSVVLNDGYPLDMTGFLHSIGKTPGRIQSTVLPETRLQIENTENFYAVLDGTTPLQKYPHYHTGKNSIVLWAKGKCFITDSGCCSYDHPDFTKWCKFPEAHSTLLVDGKGDAGGLAGKYRWTHLPRIRVHEDGGWEETSPVPEWNNVLWHRSLNQTGESLRLTDSITADRDHNYTFLFILDPDVKVEFKDDCILFVNGEITLSMEYRFPVPVRWQLLSGAVYRDFRKYSSQRLACDLSGRNIEGEILFRLQWEKS